MRGARFVSVVVAAALLAGCQGTKKQQAEPFLTMPSDMDVDIYQTPKGQDAGNAPAAKPAAGSNSSR
jgi:hypothetical protein